MKLLVCLLLFSQVTFAATENFRIQWKPGSELEVYINKYGSAPEGKKRPVLLLFGGFNSGAKVSKLVQVEQAAMVVTVQYPYKMKDKMGIFDKIAEAPKMQKAIASLIDGISAVISNLLKRQDVDAAKISIIGGSFGSPFAIHAAHQIKEISGLVLVHGFSDISTVIETQLNRHWRKNFPEIVCKVFSRISAVALTWYIDYPDLNLMLRQLTASKKVLVITAEQDKFIPESVSATLVGNLKKSAAKLTKIQLPGSHILKPGTPETKKVIEIIVDWMSSNQLL